MKKQQVREKVPVYTTEEEAREHCKFKHPLKKGVPKDHDWHQVIVKRKAVGTDVWTYNPATAYFDGKRWTLGNANNASPLNVAFWEKEPSFHNGIRSFLTEPSVRLAEAVLSGWRTEYIAAFRQYLHHPDKKSYQVAVKELERSFPDYLAPGTAEDVFQTLQREVRKGEAMSSDLTREQKNELEEEKYLDKDLRLKRDGGHPSKELDIDEGEEELIDPKELR